MRSVGNVQVVCEKVGKSYEIDVIWVASTKGLILSVYIQAAALTTASDKIDKNFF